MGTSSRTFPDVPSQPVRISFVYLSNGQFIKPLRGTLPGVITSVLSGRRVGKKKKLAYKFGESAFHVPLGLLQWVEGQG